MDLKLKNKIALICGGSRGIGLSIARTLASEGCHLGVCARNPEDLKVAAVELESYGIKSVFYKADVTVPENAESFVDVCARELGGVDILINTVGKGVGGSILKASDTDWQSTFEMNIFQVVRMIRLVAPIISKRGGGSILSIASISGRFPQLSSTRVQYGASKAALIYATAGIALDLINSGVRVNCISPGSLMSENNFWDRYRQDYPESFASHIKNAFPMGRLGKTEEVADLAAFLVSPRAYWINGQNIPIEGLQQPVPPSKLRAW
jgi:3-oxoacyl-[acyl-carrier protein] reductase